MLKVYVCGPTVYNYVHIGNLRPILTMDLILKAARNLNIDFHFVHNITDIDDKIINKSIQENKTEKEISTFFTNHYLNILKDLNIDTISKIELVTDNIDLVSEFINQIYQNNDAYIVANSVYFDVLKNKDNYGNVSNQKIDNMIFEKENDFKKFKADFALWKNTNVGIKYNSKFGLGRPGWHTECAALIAKNFNNQTIDIHGGGMDLTFPHHENENIQYFSLYNKPITKTWLRTGQIMFQEQKMSKSLNNVILASDFLKKYSADHLKFIFLLNSFTSTINIDDNLINNIEIIIKRLKNIFFTKEINGISDDIYNTEEYKKIMEFIFDRRFSDFNKSINDLIKEINKNSQIHNISLLFKVFLDLGFDIAKFDYQVYIPKYKQWKEFLKQKDYKNADVLREELMKQNLI
ncbi:class I tRNA ligase family protein [Mycoplasmopsis felis]|uniref:class I tRNA ligase family protein n=2 Tax=Mycoplasmopsis felis TaxID=33923 RepID=UPI002B00223F|nr:class I tRNA ligase family protein [Mycoplasmopsis felis]WQQ08569.1 class I tRNA ligase family protein [Mycoplasmopsis felis]